MTPYILTDLGLLPDCRESTAEDVNNAGQVVGYSWFIASSPHLGYLWEDGVMQELGALNGSTRAHAINDSGQVVGGSGHAFLWENGVMTDLGSLGGDSYDSRALDINASGQIVGEAQNASYLERACLWEDGTMLDLGTLGGPNSWATAINDSGLIVGQADTSYGESHAFLWQDGVKLDLGTFGGPDSLACDINESGQVVGWAEPASGGNNRPFLWQDGVMQDLGTFGGNFGEAFAINESGQIVGWASVPSEMVEACLWEDGAMYKLSDLTINASDWDYLWYARGINDLGQIVGYGYYDGMKRAFLLTPIPEPSALGVFALALLVVIPRLRRR